MLKNLSTNLARLPHITHFADALRDDPAHVAYTYAEHYPQPAPPWLRLAPLRKAGRAPVIAALAHALHTPCQEREARQANGGSGMPPSPQHCPPVLLYVVDTPDHAMHAEEDMRLWREADDVLLYPASASLSYEHVIPDMTMVGRRLAVLQQLAHARLHPPESPLIVVAPLKAMLQPGLTLAEVTSATTSLALNTWISQDTIIRRCMERGYRVVPVVEEPGTLARRGGIVDIWNPAHPLPLRIEWFGDEVESIRHFNPHSQRSEQRLETATIGPALDIPVWQRETLLSELAEQQLDLLRAEVRNEWESNIALLEAGGRFEGWAYFAPFFYHHDNYYDYSSFGNGNQPGGENPVAPHPRSLLAHMPAGSVVLMSDMVLLQQQARATHEHNEQQRETLTRAGELLPTFPRPYLVWAELFPAGLVQADVSNLEQLDVELLPPPDMPPEPDLVSQETGSSAERGGQIVDIDLDVGAEQTEDEEQAIESVEVIDADNVVVVSFDAPIFTQAELFSGQIRRFVRDVAERLQHGEHVVIVTTQAARFQELVDQAMHGTAERVQQTARTNGPAPLPPLTFVHGTLSEGWRLPAWSLTLYTDTEIFGWHQRRPVERHERYHHRPSQESNTDDRAAFLRGLKPGEYVVHIEHGIALYEGLIRRSVGGVEREYLNLRYASGDRLYVPVDQLDRVARYVGAGDSRPRLTRLGTQEWAKAKRKAREAVRDMADELIELYAQRKLSQGHAFSPDNEWQQQMEAMFPYIETNDQLRTLSDVKRDMQSPHPMDRLICGDVGFGKTEVALRAAFKAVQDSKQVAILVPTTVLAQQHYETFSQRLQPFPIQVEMLSRFRSPKAQDTIIQQVLRGRVDIIIGTHRLLSRDVSFKNLGLLIIDEEQRFGVRHKERIKQLRSEVDVLTLTATPIPRTLHMALAGIRDMSVINTPPEDRVPIKTYVVPTSNRLIRTTVQRELDRGGQVYFVHNRVHSIERVVERLRKLVPDARIGVGHGQLEERQLEQVMLDFFKGQYDILVCTTIIENGLDVPNANTIIIDNAPDYGLAQLYQLRGRVGRSTRRAYAYMLYRQHHSMTREAAQRLQAIQEATELGSGFRIAMRDLEIRGAGNMLGEEQSGHIAAVGFDLYSRLLEQAVHQLKQGKDTAAETGNGTQPAGDNDKRTPPPRGQHAAPADDGSSSFVVDEHLLVHPLVTLSLPLSAYLPEEYIPDDSVRLDVYRRMIGAQTPERVQTLRRELRDRFGELPAPAAHLLTWLHIKALALQAGVSSISTTDEEFLVRLPREEHARQRLQRRFGRDSSITIGAHFVSLNRRMLNEGWAERLVGVLEVLTI